MISVKLQYNKSETNKLYKDVDTVVTVNGILRDGTGILNPVIMFELSSIPLTVNYATIEEFGRSYFIGEPVSVRNGLWEIPMHVDALSSWATPLSLCEGVVERNEEKYNLYLKDNIIEIPAHTTEHIMFPNKPTGLEFVLLTF